MPQALSLLTAAGIPVAGWESATDAEMALTAAARLGFPVVMKLSAPSLVHKTEAGGVVLNLVDIPGVAAAYKQLAGLAARAVPPGGSLGSGGHAAGARGRGGILGGRRDQSFGPLVAYGAGGVLTEIMEDVALRVAPISPGEARRQILETRLGRILEGVGPAGRGPRGPEPGPVGAFPRH